MIGTPIQPWIADALKARQPRTRSESGRHMAIATEPRTDQEIQDDVLAEMKWA
jgi:hypothetical protein